MSKKFARGESGFDAQKTVSVRVRESTPVPDTGIVWPLQCTACSESRALSSESPW